MSEEENFFDLDALNIPTDVIALIDREIARAYRVIPVNHNEGILTVAIEEPMGDCTLLDLVFMLEPIEIHAVHANGDAIDRALKRYYGITALEIPASLGPEDLLDQKNARHEEDSLRVMPTLLEILERSVSEHAERVIVEVFRGKGHTRSLAPSGSTLAAGDMVELHARAVIDRIKIMAALHIEERQKQQDGRIEIEIEDQMIDVDVTTAPVLDGEIAVLQIHYRESWR